MESLRGRDVHGRQLASLALAALGIVFGDIGTSPLYAIRECFHGDYGIAPTAENLLGVLSLIFWSLAIVVSIKYLTFILRADNQGEGGVIALTALVRPTVWEQGRGKWLLVACGLFGASLLYGDGMITPAISVLSAIEGLHVITPVFEPHIVPAMLVVVTERIPRVPREEKIELHHLEGGFYRIIAHFGFAENPSVPYILALAGEKGLGFELEEVSFFLGRERLVRSKRPGMARWRTRIFQFMSHNAQSATAFFHIPPDQVVEIGIQLQM